MIDLSRADIWDASSVAITTKYAARGKTVEIIDFNEPSATMHESLAGQLKVGH